MQFDIKKIVRRVISEEEQVEEKKQRCLTTNTSSLDEIVGDSDSFKTYAPSITKRSGGINGIVDTLDLLKTIRLNNTILIALKFVSI